MEMLEHDYVQRWGVVGLAVLAAGLYVASFWMPYWSFTLHAPQYPDGLTVEIFLDHLEGDVREVNGLNHYIGMRSLEEAARFERSVASWGIGLVAVLTLGFVTLPGRRFGWLAIVPAVAFPAAFVTDTYYWLYTFGQNLDPRAPIEIEPFVPTMFGRGTVGQFETIAVPQAGFYMTLGALVLVFAAWLLRRRVCATCELREGCEAVCPRGMVGPEPGSRRETQRGAGDA